ncbi:MAG TPA: DUF1592 domain-containing protein [Polyangiaceae bacterium]|nr:DUF1592 domain-containing protein [Polyangiaceae bacterium]
MRISSLAVYLTFAAGVATAMGCNASIEGTWSGLGTAGASAAGGNAAVGGAGTQALEGPGRVVMHRLNIAEYDNTVRDLLQTKLRLSENFPPDDSAYGFDNVSAALSMTDVTLSYYIDVAKKLAAEALSAERRASVVTCDLTAGTSCVTSVLQAFLPRAWRRPAQPGEIDRLVALYSANKADSATDDEALGRVLQAVLLAPQFLYRIELNSGVAGVRRLDGYEIASRLAYFLWSSMPDQELMSAAQSGRLTDAAGLTGQVSRLLTDGKAAALAERFGSQWLAVRSLDNVHPDATVYPMFDEALRAAMRDETMRLFTDVASGQRPLGELLTTSSGYVNARLAQHYGVPSVTSQTPVFTALPAERGGILMQASLLTVLSHPKESAPVLRGKWILTQLLCREPPPPPPDVPQEPAPQTGTSRRERLNAHRVDPVCKSCHEQMDPLGLALENYDGVGAYRTTDNGAPIDPSGTLADGTAFTTPQQLAQIIAQDPALLRCVSQHLFTYGLGRAPRAGSSFDAATLDAVTKSFSDAGQLFPKLVEALVASDAFRTREDEVAP